jgi:hypothetical protein
MENNDENAKFVSSTLDDNEIQLVMIRFGLTSQYLIPTIERTEKIRVNWIKYRAFNPGKIRKTCDSVVLIESGYYFMIRKIFRFIGENFLYANNIYFIGDILETLPSCSTDLNRDSEPKSILNYVNRERRLGIELISQKNIQRKCAVYMKNNEIRALSVLANNYLYD